MRMRRQETARQVCHLLDLSPGILSDREPRDVQADPSGLWLVGLWSDRVREHSRLGPSRRRVSSCHMGSHELAQGAGWGIVWSVSRVSKTLCESITSGTFGADRLVSRVAKTLCESITRFLNRPSGSRATRFSVLKKTHTSIVTKQR